MAFSQATINSTDPAGAESVSLGASRIRNLSAAIKERLASAFVAPDTDPMVLKASSMPTNIVNLTTTGQVQAADLYATDDLVVGDDASIVGDLTVGGTLAVVGAISGPISLVAATGTLPNASFPATLPVASGLNLTALNATNLASGTLDNNRLNVALGSRTFSSLEATSIAIVANNPLNMSTGGTGSGPFVQLGTRYVSATPGSGTPKYIRINLDGADYKIEALPGS